jgi:hypothetical protein
MNPQELSLYSEVRFKRLTGVSRSVFISMLKVLEDYDTLNRSCKGQKSEISLENQLLITVLYWKQYCSQMMLGYFFGLHESNVCRIIDKTEQILHASKQFDLPEKVLNETAEEDTFIVDATEIPIQRPLINQSESYSGKKKAQL